MLVRRHRVFEKIAVQDVDEFWLPGASHQYWIVEPKWKRSDSWTMSVLPLARYWNFCVASHQYERWANFEPLFDLILFWTFTGLYTSLHSSVDEGEDKSKKHTFLSLIKPSNPETHFLPLLTFGTLPLHCCRQYWRQKTGYTCQRPSLVHHQLSY